MAKLKGKRPSESAVETRYLLMPDEANPYGTAFGGVIVAWMDKVASMAAQRHSGKEVVTVGIDSLSFKEPARIGDHVVLKASVNYVGRTSMEVGVRVTKEDPYTGKGILATTAYLTFVALGRDKKPSVVEPIVPETAEEKRRYENAKLRVKSRKELRSRMK